MSSVQATSGTAWLGRSCATIASFVAAAGLLIAAAILYFDINTGFAGISTPPDSLPAKQAFLILDKDFSAGLMSPAQVVIDGNVSSPQVQQAVQHLDSIFAGDAAFGKPTYEANASGNLPDVRVETPLAMTRSPECPALIAND